MVLKAIGTKRKKFLSSYACKYTYTVGKMAIPDKYDPDRRNECSHGIHFYITKIEAENN